MKAKRFEPLFLFVVFGIVLSFLPVSKGVAADLRGPQVAIKGVSDKLKIKLQDEMFKKDFNKITGFVREVVDPMIDFNRISALVLGKLWKKATLEQKQRFKKEFHTLLIRTYSRAFFEFKDWSVRFLPLRLAEGGKKVIVKTEVIQPGLQPLAINYRMILRKGKWKAYDIMIEGVSLVTNYRTSIKNEYQKAGSIDAVIDKLAKRNSEALAPKKHS